MNGNDRVPVLGFHFQECLVPEDTGVVHDDIDLSVSIQGGLDDILAAFGLGNAIIVGHGLPAGCLYFRHHFIGSLGSATGAVARASKVVNNHLCSALGQLYRAVLAKTGTRAGDNGYSSCEIDFWHLFDSFSCY